MTGTIDYSKKPSAFYAFSTSPNDQTHLRDLSIHRVQFIPWDQPQSDEDAKLIRASRFGNVGLNSVAIDANVHDPDLGYIRNIACYYAPNNAAVVEYVNDRSPASLRRWANHLSIENVVDFRGDKPDKKNIKSIAST